jgi:hypothetical protein
MTNSDFLRGPWMAVLTDQHGYVFTSFDVAREETTDDSEEFRVSIVRGTAMPSEDDVRRAVRPDPQRP